MSQAFHGRIKSRNNLLNSKTLLASCVVSISFLLSGATLATAPEKDPALAMMDGFVAVSAPPGVWPIWNYTQFTITHANPDWIKVTAKAERLCPGWRQRAYVYFNDTEVKDFDVAAGSMDVWVGQIVQGDRFVIGTYVYDVSGGTCSRENDAFVKWEFLNL